MLTASPINSSACTYHGATCDCLLLYKQAHVGRCSQVNIGGDVRGLPSLSGPRVPSKLTAKAQLRRCRTHQPPALLPGWLCPYCVSVASKHVLRGSYRRVARTDQADHQHCHPNGNSLCPRLLSALRWHGRPQNGRHLVATTSRSDNSKQIQNSGSIPQVSIVLKGKCPLIVCI